MAGYSYLKTEVYNNFYEMLSGALEKSAKRIAVRYRENDTIIDVSYRRFVQEISSIYCFFKEKKIENCNIGIVSENRYAYLTLYLAAAFSNVIAPIDKETVDVALWEQVGQFDIAILLYTNQTKHLVASQARQQDVVCMNIDEMYPEMIAKAYPIASFFSDVKHVDSDKFSVLAFTSGTTGALKGAMLSQRNVTACLRGALQNNVLKSPSLAVLPMNHTYGFNPGILCTLYHGGTVCLTMHLKQFQRDLKAYNPYFVSLVPMVVEGMYQKILAEARRRGKEKTLQRMVRLSNWLLKRHIDIRKLLFGNLLNKRLKFISCGGAPLNPFYVERFLEFGVYLLNGYGLTECSPLICINREFDMDPESVGTVIQEDEVRIAEDGEILIKGPNVMLGYYKNPEETRNAMVDGYFRTGDFGYMVERRLYVTGRKKNLILLDNGKNVVPEVIEAKLQTLPWVKECLVTTRQVKNSRILIAFMYAPERPETAEEDLQKVNAALPAYMQLADYVFTGQELEKNSSRKILREQYEEKCADAT